MCTQEIKTLKKSKELKCGPIVHANKQLRAFRDKESPMTRFQITISGFKRGTENPLVVVNKITLVDITREESKNLSSWTIHIR